MQTERIIFANLLRGIAAITVLISHYVGIFWVMHPTISSMMGVPTLEKFPHLDFILKPISEYCIVLGQFGVGIFFIVSGLVIPFSLKNDSKVGFLYRRAIRIYPVYITGFCTVIFSLFLLSQYAKLPFVFLPGDIIAHFGVITRAPLEVTRIDGISWTLEVEISFYLVMCLFGKKIVNFNASQYLSAALGIAAIATITFQNQSYLVGVQVAAALLLLLGCAYYSLMHKKNINKKLLGNPDDRNIAY